MVKIEPEPLSLILPRPTALLRRTQSKLPTRSGSHRDALALVLICLGLSAFAQMTVVPNARQSGPGGGNSNASLRAGGVTGVAGGRSSLAGWQAFANAKNEELDAGTIRLGQAAIILGCGLQLEYDTNVNASSVDPISDISLTPRLNIGFTWPITRQNQLSFQLGLQYRKYLIHPDLDSNNFTINPGTVIDYKFFTGDFVISLYDAPAITTDTGDDPGVFNTVNFNQLENTAGLSIQWDLNKVISLIGFERKDIRSLSGTFASNDRVSHTVYATANFELTPTSTLGPVVAVSRNEYVESVLNNSTTFLAGIRFTSRLTDLTSYTLEAGMQGADFADNGNQSNQVQFDEVDGFNENVESTLGGGDYLQPYARLSITNKLNTYYSHGLALSREAQGSSISNYRETNSISYNGSLRLNSKMEVGFATAYEFGTFSSTDPVNYSTWRTGLRLGLDIARDMSVSFFYDYLVNDLDVENGGYIRQRFGVAAAWTF